MSILSLYFLASSSPNKGDVFESEVFVCINPLALRALPLYFAAQNTGGERVRCISPFLLGSDVIQNDPSCCGVRQGERVRCISLLSLLRCYSKRLAMLRGMVGGRGLKSTFNILNSSIAVPRSITGCGVSYIGEVSQSDGGVENAIVSVCLYWIYPFLL